MKWRAAGGTPTWWGSSNNYSETDCRKPTTLCCTTGNSSNCWVSRCPARFRCWAASQWAHRSLCRQTPQPALSTHKATPRLLPDSLGRDAYHAARRRSFRARAAGGRLHEVPALDRALPRGGGRQAPGVHGLGLLGPAGSLFRRPGREAADDRPGAGRAWLQPHRPHVHGRPLRRLPLQGSLPDRVCLAALQQVPRRRSHAPQRLYHRRRPLRPSGEQADARGDAQLPAVSGAGTGLASKRARGGGAGQGRLRRVPVDLARSRADRQPFGLRVRARRGARDRPRPAAAHQFLSSEPAEHLHRPPDGAHAPCGVRASAGGW